MSGPRVLARFKIPKSHPRAPAIVALAQNLATRSQTEGGLIVEHLARPDADLEFLAALREFVDVDEIARLIGPKVGAGVADFLGRPGVLSGILALATRTPMGKIATPDLMKTLEGYLR